MSTGPEFKQTVVVPEIVPEIAKLLLKIWLTLSSDWLTAIVELITKQNVKKAYKYLGLICLSLFNFAHVLNLFNSTF